MNGKFAKPILNNRKWRTMMERLSKFVNFDDEFNAINLPFAMNVTALFLLLEKDNNSFILTK